MSAQKPSDPSAPRIIPVEPESTSSIGRRAVLQSLVGGIGAGLALPGMADAHPMQQHAGSHARVATAQKKAAAKAYKPEFLDAHQLQTLDVLSERIVPGSTSAKVAPFIDQLLAVDTQDNQGAFLSALGAFEMLAIDKYAKPWKGLTAAQQDELLTTASTADSGRPRPGMNMDPRQPAPMAGKLTIRDHFDNLRGWISGAYYSSEAGMRELGWNGQLFFDKLPGCDHPDGHSA
jgi:hypothetical protein